MRILTAKPNVYNFGTTFEIDPVLLKKITILAR